MVMLVPQQDILDLDAFFTGINPSFGAAGIDANLEAAATPFQVPGFSDVPLVINVENTPIDTGFPVSISPTLSADCGGLCSPRPAELVFDQTKEGEVTRVADFIDFAPIGGIDFPTARPTDPLAALITGGFQIANTLLQPTVGTSALQQLPNTQVMQVNTQTAVCPPSRLGHRQHLTKPRKGVPQHCAPNRHMNSLNPHALRRATRRLKGFMGHVQSAQKAIRQALGHTLPRPHRSPRPRGGCVTCGARSARSCVC